jgi:predicted Rossmann-fold nucleotide-binding protein
VRATHGRVVSVESRADLDERLAAGAHDVQGWRLHGLDLRGQVDALLERGCSGATLLGSTLDPGAGDRLAAAGALVLPRIQGIPVDPYRSSLYDAATLYDTEQYADSFDAKAYAWSLECSGPDDLVATALHDQAIDSALDVWRRDRRLVGVMGGHAVARGEPAYADAARLGHELARGPGGATLATGGGPGAMEAVNLGARFAPAGAADLDHALRTMARTPSFRPSPTDWLATAFEVLEQAPRGESLGIPTWHYGHEPANVFASGIAKYFRNSQREAVLLEVCNGGIVFLPGSAGTVQEIFADACENYYADESSIAPMVLVGVDYWTRTLPAWPLLMSLASSRSMRDRIHLVTDVTDAAAIMA